MALAAFHTAEVLPALARILLLVWPFWLLLAGFGLFRLVVRRAESRRLAASGILELDGLTAPEFDDRIAALFRDLGFSVSRLGGDLVVQKDGRVAVVQPAPWSDSVDSDAVRNADAARRHHGADEAWLVTNHDFTKNALRVASRTGVDLWNRERLMSSLRRVS